MGGGDRITLCQFVRRLIRISDYQSTKKQDYMNTIKALDLKFTYLDSDVFHLPHGAGPNRQYLQRHSMLPDLNIDTELVKNADGILEFVNPEKYIDFKAPSPVYPDLVALPLMSKERCYGPWFSNSIVNNLSGKKTYKNLGGKVEFLKHENLAPWNYAGYQLMNQAGVLEAQFANSLLLFTERGGFKYGGIPTGVVLAKYFHAVLKLMLKNQFPHQFLYLMQFQFLKKRKNPNLVQ